MSPGPLSSLVKSGFERLFCNLLTVERARTVARRLLKDASSLQILFGLFKPLLCFSLH